MPGFKLALDGARVGFELGLEDGFHAGGRSLVAIVVIATGSFEFGFVRRKLGQAVDDGPKGRRHTEECVDGAEARGDGRAGRW